LLFNLNNGSFKVWHTDKLIKLAASKFSCWVLRNIQRRFWPCHLTACVLCAVHCRVAAKREGWEFQKRNISWKYLSDPSQRKF
jgi:hypothetical protein